MKPTQNLIPALLSLCLYFSCFTSLTGRIHDDSLAFRYFEKATLLTRQRNYDSSLYYFDRAAVLFLNEGIRDKYVETLTKKAFVLSYQNMIDSANSLIDKTIQLSRRLDNDSSRLLVDAYDLKGRLMTGYSDFEGAIRYMQMALYSSIEVYGEDHRKTSSAHGNLGIVYSFDGQYRKTIYHCTRASDIIRKKYGEDHPSIASSYNTIGNVYIDLGKLDSAQLMHEKALAIRKKVLGENHLNTAASYSNLSVIYYEKGDYQKALNYEKSVFAIRKSVFGEEHPLTA
ncbi:MAG: tetratricopeptide repeat protein, partial [Bacteroidales bacterium]